MNEPWIAEHAVGADLARALLAAQHPDLAGASIERLGEGWDNTAYRVGGAWVFRFPRRQIAVPLIEQEIRLLPAIAPQVPLPIPRPERIGRPEARYPWPFAGYRLLPGRTACAAMLDDEQRCAAAAPLARFLAALHAFPADEARALGIGGDSFGRMNVAKRSRQAAEALDEFTSMGLLDDAQRRSLDRLIAATPVKAPRPPAAVVHGDLYTRHVLVDERGAPSGIIDWGDVHLGDPAVDLAIAPLFLPPAAHDAFRRAYGEVDAVTWQLARFRALDHTTATIRYAQRTGDADLLREGGLALQWLAAENPI